MAAARRLAFLVVVMLSTTSVAAAGPSAGADRTDPAAPTSSGSSPGHVAPPSTARVGARTITFDEVPLGATVTTQYRDRGVVFSGGTFTTEDISNPTTPVLSGDPQFFGPVKATFTRPGTTTPAPVTGFTLDVGYIDARDSVEVRYFDASGRRLGSVRAQSYAINTITVDYANLASFIVRTVSNEPAGFAIDNLRIRRAPAGIKPTRMASFGDSFSSGEGLLGDQGLRYDCATSLHRTAYHEDTSVFYGGAFLPVHCDTRTLSNRVPADFRQRPLKSYENLCHRHARAYPNAIRSKLGISARNAMFVACSAAVTDNILSRGQFGSPGSPVNIAGAKSQLSTVETWAAAGAPDFVTVGIGGNDAKFRPIIENCMWHACTEDTEWQEGVLDTIRSTVYTDVRRTYARIRSRFPGATVAAFGYPSVIGDPAKDCAGVKAFGGALRIEEPERRWLKRTVFTALNQALREAAAAAGVTFIDITSVTEGHEICTQQPWINGLMLSLGGPRSESFHPNEFAHDAITTWFMKHYTRDGRLLFRNPAPAPPIDPAVEPSISDGLVLARTYQGGEERGCLQGCPLTVHASGFEPGATVPLRVRSLDPALETPVEVALGPQTADSTGRFAAAITMPARIGPGLYSLEVAGRSPSGLTQYGATTVRIYETDPGPVVDLQVDGSVSGRVVDRRIRVRCASSVPDTPCRSVVVVKVGRRVIARGATSGRTDENGLLVLWPSLTRPEARRIWRALADGRRVKVVARTTARVPLDSATDRAVRRLRAG